MAYTKTEWINGETPVSAENMNKIEEELYYLHNMAKEEAKNEYSESQTSTYSCDYLNNLAGTILYKNDEGTTGNLTLLDDISNYDYYEIIPFGNENESVRGRAGNSVAISRVSSDGTYVYTNTGQIQVTGTSLTKNNIHNYYGSTSNVYQTHTTDDWYPIWLVIGYKLEKLRTIN